MLDHSHFMRKIVLLACDLISMHLIPMLRCAHRIILLVKTRWPTYVGRVFVATKINEPLHRVGFVPLMRWMLTHILNGLGIWPEEGRSRRRNHDWSKTVLRQSVPQYCLGCREYVLVGDRMTKLKTCAEIATARV